MQNISKKSSMLPHPIPKQKLSELINKTHTFLYRKGSYFAEQERFIHNLFKNEHTPDNVRTRILVLDSLYSTQLKMHRYTTDDLIDTLSHTSVGNFKEFITGKWIDDDNAYAELCKLITGEYFGIDITRPITLLSKYFYFLSDFRFPICDSLARTSLSYIYGGRYSMYANQFFKKISELKRGLGTTYQCLDKFLWL